MALTINEVVQLARHSLALTGHNNKMGGLDALLIWQYVRFNNKYRRDYLNLINSLNENANNEDQRDFLVQSFCSYWCVSEPMNFEIEKLHDNFYFEYRLVRKIDSLARENYLFDFNRDPQQPEVVLAINTRADKRLILKEIESYLDQDGDTLASDGLRPNSLAHLSDNFFCFYLKEVMGLTNKQIKLDYVKVSANALQDSQIQDKIDSFRSNSAKAPWCFFAATQ